MTRALGGWRPDRTMLVDAPATDYLTQHTAEVMKAGLTAPTASPELNGVLDLRGYCSPVENQLSAGSCVGQAVVGALEFLQIRNGQPLVDLSRLFVYFNSRLKHGESDVDRGTYIHLAFQTLSTLGTCSEKAWPHDLDQLFIRPSLQAYREAYANKTSAYYAITGTGQVRDDYIRLALLAQHPVVFGMRVDEAYQMYEGGIVAMPKSVRVNPGGHAQTIVGYDEPKQCWIVRNSWGTSFGHSGYAYVPYAYLDAAEAEDIWVPYLNTPDTTTVTVTKSEAAQ